jgi:hypothetical protein
MPWTTPSTVVPGQVATAALWNSEVGANLIDLDSRLDLAQQLDQETLSPSGSGSLGQATDTSVLLLDPSGAYDFYGAEVPARAPFAMEILNISGNNVTLKHESLSEATPAKRFRLPGLTDLVIGQGNGVRLLYISVPVGARWCSVVAA